MPLQFRDPRQLLQLHAPDNASNPSASLSKANLAATGPSHLFLERSRLPFARLQAFKPSRRPFQGNSCSFLRAFPRQLVQLHAPDNASNPSASLSKGTLAATGPSHLFLERSRLSFARPQTLKTLKPLKHLKPLKPLKPRKPSRRPFQGNSCSFPHAFPRQLSQLNAPDNASSPSASLSTATLAATGPSHLFLERSRLPFARLQTATGPSLCF